MLWMFPFTIIYVQDTGYKTFSAKCKVSSYQWVSHFFLGFPTQDAANPVGTSAANPTEPTGNSTSKWSKIKIVTKQTGDECITAIEIVPPVQGSERHSIPINRPRTVARKFASIARSQVKRKRQMAAREKKVCTFKVANIHMEWKIHTVVPAINFTNKNWFLFLLFLIFFNLFYFLTSATMYVWARQVGSRLISMILYYCKYIVISCILQSLIQSFYFCFFSFTTGDQDYICHSAGFHHYMDTIQCHGVDLNLLPVLCSGHCVGHRLLALLCQLYYQSSLLCTVQCHIQKDI